MNIFVFDIETIPDVVSGRRLYELDKNLSDKEVADFMFAQRREQTGGSDFLRLHLQRIAAISVVLRSHNTFKVWSLGDTQAAEKEILERFFAGIEKYTPTLVSWNGSGFDLPVIHYRALVHGVVSENYWETGDNNQAFKWNNYLNRYHYRHLDLMDVLSAYQARAVAPLDDIAMMLGLPGKMGMDGGKVWEYYLRGELSSIRDYCETDVLNTYLVYLRFELIRGKLLPAQYEEECQRVRDYLHKEAKPHFVEFLSAWQ